MDLRQKGSGTQKSKEINVFLPSRLVFLSKCLKEDLFRTTNQLK